MPEILVVCTGNICRSPLGEAALRARLGELASVSSSGTYGEEGYGATEGSVTAGRELGLELATHVARRLTTSQLGAADLILAMESEHRDFSVGLMPETAARTFTLKELVTLLERAPIEGDLADRIAEADRRRSLSPADGDIGVSDPWGNSIETYRRIANEIDEWTERLVDRLFGPAPAIAENA